MNIRIEMFVEQDDTPIRGNASAIDEKTDLAIENEIISRLEEGDIWAWAAVEVRATNSETGEYDYECLGCCSYNSADDFKSSGYYSDMAIMAVTRLLGGKK
jgi:hypothetical protein